MPKQTIPQQAAALPDSTKKHILQLVGTGKSIVYISDKLHLNYDVIQRFLWEEGRLPGQGAKSIVTRRLQKLITATKERPRAPGR